MQDDTAQNIDLQKCLHAQQTVDKDKNNMCQELSAAPVGLGLCQPNTDTTAASHALHDCLSLNRGRTNILAILLHHTNAYHNTTLTNHKQQTDAASHILALTHTYSDCSDNMHAHVKAAAPRHCGGMHRLHSLHTSVSCLMP